MKKIQPQAIHKHKFLRYSDTDSLYLELEKFIPLICPGETDQQKIADALDIFIEGKIQPIIDKYYKQEAEYFNAKNTMIMKRESISPVGFFKDVKKHYAIKVLDEEGVRLNEPSLKIKGIAVVKTSTPKICRTSLRAFISLMLDFEDPFLPDSIGQMEVFINTFRKTFFSQRPEDIAIPSGMKELKVGKGASPVHRGAGAYNKYIRDNNLIQDGYEPIQEDAKIKYIMLKQGNPFSSDSFGFIDKLPEEIKQWTDYEAMFVKSYLKTLDDILKPLRLSVDLYQKKTTVNSFFC